MIYRIIFCFIAIVGYSSLAKKSAKNWREDFNPSAHKGKHPSGWEINATKWGVNKTSFELKSEKSKIKKDFVLGILKVFAKQATGALFFEPYKMVDLSKTPVLRWRWKVSTFPKGGDGRKSNLDDQAIVIYVGANDWMIKKSIAYRWETETPKGTEGKVDYAGGAVKVKWFCLRNRKSGENKWMIEERNIREDFKKAYGFVPKKFVISIGANSQHTKSESLAYIDFIEFIPAQKAQAIKVAARSEKK